MNIFALLADLAERDVQLDTDGLTLRASAPKGVLTDDLLGVLREHKRPLIRHMERQRCRLEEAERRNLIIRWSKEPGWIFLHDPTTGMWHEVRASECLPLVLEPRTPTATAGDAPRGPRDAPDRGRPR